MIPDNDLPIMTKTEFNRRLWGKLDTLTHTDQLLYFDFLLTNCPEAVAYMARIMTNEIQEDYLEDERNRRLDHA
jgi:hypothetical protein